MSMMRGSGHGDGVVPHHPPGSAEDHRRKPPRVNAPAGDGPPLKGFHPLPVRLSPVYTQSAGGDKLESALVESALRSLPEELTVVVQKHNLVQEECRKQMVILGQLKADFQKEEGEIRELNTKMQHFDKSLLCHQAGAKEMTDLCKTIEDDITMVTKSIEDTRSEMEQMERERIKDRAEADVYKERMLTHERQAEELDMKKPLFQELHQLREDVDQLQEQKENEQWDLQLAECENKEEALRTEIESLERMRDLKQIRHEDKRKQLHEIREKEKRIKLETETLRKRNVAQMTRLKKQVKEVTSQNRYWDEQIRILQPHLDQTRTQLALQ